MSKFKIIGGETLEGIVRPIGNKNAVLKMIPATLLTNEKVTITNVADISDVLVMLEIMKELGSDIDYNPQTKILNIQTSQIKTTKINPILATKLRASNMFLGPILARMGEVTNVIPGGDKIGPREMNAHFDGFTQLGAKITNNPDKTFTLSGKLYGTDIFLYEPSVTATENLILASVLAEGNTTIFNAACEPHVKALCYMLNSMGAKISGIGTNYLQIEGVNSLGRTEYVVPTDHIYVGTFLAIGAMNHGEIKISDVNHDDMKPILYLYEKIGLKTLKEGNTLILPANQTLEIEDTEWARTKGFYSQPWPCFPTDMMSLAIVMATQTKGSLLFFEKMYPGRMFFANYLNGIGANIIQADPHRIMVTGPTKLKGGGTLSSPDLRAGMAYLTAGLCAQGETFVENIEHIDRGYPHMETILSNLGGKVERIE